MTDTPERLDMRAAMEQNAKAATSWFTEWEKAADALAAAQARIAELEAERDRALELTIAAQEHAQYAQDKWEAARAEALEEAEAAVAAVEIPDGGWPSDRPGVWVMALDCAMAAIRAALDGKP